MQAYPIHRQNNLVRFHLPYTYFGYTCVGSRLLLRPISRGIHVIGRLVGHYPLAL
jgi:hypothetical protein